MKKFFMLLLVTVFAFNVTKVAAEEIFYENDKGVTFTKEEYDYITYMFWDGFQDEMTEADYDKYIDYDLINSTKKGKVVYEPPVTRATYIEDRAARLEIAYICGSTDCLVSVNYTWKVNPTVRSYDVMGAYLYNTSLTNTPTTYLSSTQGGQVFTNYRMFSNGFGISMQLPQYASDLIFNQNFRVEEQGTVYASYQHAMRNISLANSQNYTLSRVGYGNVFNFSGVAANTYDRMNGVEITL